MIVPAYGALPETSGGYARLYAAPKDHRAHVAAFVETLAGELAVPWRGRTDVAVAQQAHCATVFSWSRCLDDWRDLIKRLVGSPAAIVAPSTTIAKPQPISPEPADRLDRALGRLRQHGFMPSAILDVGAHDGAFARAARCVFPDAHIVMVDALEEKDAVLRAVAASIGNASHKIALLGEQEGVATPFFVVDTHSRPDLVTTGSSMLRENTAFPMTTRTIRQRTLSSLLDDRGYALIKLDVQGAELEVLRGLGDRLNPVEVILIELSLVAYNEGAPLLDEVTQELAKMGFVLYDLADDTRYCDGRLLQLDGVFVRRDAALRPKPPFWS